MSPNLGTLNSELRTLNSKRIERILNSGFRAVLVTTGGGSGALNALLATPGASRFITEAHVPYSPEALKRFLGETPEHFVSPATAANLARKAVENVGQASCLSGQAGRLSYVMGIACTAALQTDRERRGEDRAFICIKTAEAENLYAIYFSKISRAEQEALLSDWLLVLIAQAVGAERGLMLPGSFNPVHQGHCNLLKVAEEMTGLRGIFELSCANVDKPDIPEEEILRRAATIKNIPVALTHAPRFIQKAQLFQKTTFVLGYDTAERLIAYAKPGEWELFKTLETKFLVAGRFFQGLDPKRSESAFEYSQKKRLAGERQNVDAVSSPRFQSLENLNLPKGFESLFEAIPESKFREDISSTELRSA